MTLDNLRADLVAEALIDILQAQTTVTSLLPSGATEIRESQWQGRDFTYPNIRLRMIRNAAVDQCNLVEITISWEVFSEQASSSEANKICGKIRHVLHGKCFTQNGLNVSLAEQETIPAIRRDIRTWRGELIMRGRVSG